MKIKLVFIFHLEVEIKKNVKSIFDVYVCQQVAMLCHRSLEFCPASRVFRTSLQSTLVIISCIICSNCENHIVIIILGHQW